LPVWSVIDQSGGIIAAGSGCVKDLGGRAFAPAECYNLIMKKLLLALGLLFSLTACGRDTLRASPDLVATVVAGTLTALPPENPAALTTSIPEPSLDIWVVYTHPVQPFSLTIPADFEIYPDNQALSPYLGGNIKIQYRERPFEECQGECRSIESQETVVVAGQEAREFRGSIGSLGDTNPQEYLAYEIPHHGLNYVFVLYALPHDAPFVDAAIIQPLKPDDVLLFEQIMQTLTFTD